MKRIALLAAVAATLAAPAFAQSAALSTRATAIAHFNSFADNASQLIVLNGVGTRGGASGTTATTLDVLNATQDTAAEITGGRVTTVSGTPAHGADIFARLRAASAEDE